ncbi:MAG: rhamnogalacturonan acetylesterase [Bacteroidales bacterium]
MKHAFLIISLLFLCIAATVKEKETPTLYLIGDSTVDHGTGRNGLWGWGKYLPQFFDTEKIQIKNYARAGTSTRTFQTNGLPEGMKVKRGLWDSVNVKLKKGDYLLIQFGLNDQAAINDTSRARGTIRGIGEDSTIIINGLTKKQEVVHSFGWYLRRYINQAKAKGVTVIVCSTIPKNRWENGKLIRGEQGFADWAMQVAKQEKVLAIDLNSKIADIYDSEGEKAVTEKYHIATDNTHTTEGGAILNASIVAKSIGEFGQCDLKKYLLKK